VCWQLGVLLAAMAVSGPAAAGETSYFEHHDKRYLREGQRKGGAAFVPTKVQPDIAVPLVVFLHGTNARGRLHPWLRAGARDLRLLAETLVDSGEVAPFVLAGPTQSQDAVLGKTLWAGFDLAHFVDDVRDAIGPRALVDPSAVALFGHSGAGCNPAGGLASNFEADGSLQPFVLVAIDPCLDAEMGAAIAGHSPQIPFWLLWQTEVWRRDFEAWWSAAALRPVAPRITEVQAHGPNPHDGIVPVAFARALRELFVPVPPAE
jgi:hypothetical protein